MTIIFFFPVILRDAHRRIYGMDKLEQDGNEVIILDATQYYKMYRPTFKDPFISDRLMVCREKSDFIDFEKKLGKSPVIFVTDNLYMKMAFEELNKLIRNQDRLLVSSTRFTAGHYKYPKGIQRTFSLVLRQADNYFPLHLFKLYYKYIKKTYVPDYFLGATKFLTANNTILSVKKRNRIYVHSDDINFAYTPMNKVIDPFKKVGVFLDQMLPYFNGRNPDIQNNNINREYKLDYYSSLVKFFKKIQEDLELDEIVIALHPEAGSIREVIDAKFAPFKTYIGLSNELIKDATVVFGHYSTVLGMAAFYQKPIILLTDKNILNREDRSRHLNAYCHELGLEKIQFDENTQKMNKDLLQINVKLYNNYIKKFLKEIPYEGNAFYFAINQVKREMLESKEETVEIV